MPENQATTPLPLLSAEEASILAVENAMVQSISGIDGLGGGNPGIAAQAALYHLQSGGNRTRARICLSASLSLGVAHEDAVRLSACVELLHNASLIHDDLQDQEKMRHAARSVWIEYNPGIAICAGDLMISSAFGVLATVSKLNVLPSLLSATHNCVSKAIRGQCEDLNASDPSQMTQESYTEVVKAKSGALLSLPLELALIASENFLSLSHARKAAEDFSVGYQIADDLIDIQSDAAADGKPASLNIFFLIKKDMSDKVARETANAIGRTHFASAHHLASKLPCESGQYLQKLATEMATFL